MNEFDHLAIFDVELIKKLFNNDRQFAHEIISKFLLQLPDELTAINRTVSAKDYIALKHLVHKLHGIICYCGAPRLKSITAQLERAITQGLKTRIDLLICEFNTAANDFQAFYNRIDLLSY